MAYNRDHARKLCTAAELDLFQASLSDAIGKLDAATLRGKIRRARDLRDKSRDLFRRQTAAIRTTTGSKRGSSSVANQRTEQKAKLFAETLQRFEKRLTQLEAAQARKDAREKLVAIRAAARAAGKAGTAAAGPARSKGRGAAKAASPAPGRAPAGRSDPHAQTRRAHVTAAGKRAQARRDKR